MAWKFSPSSSSLPATSGVTLHFAERLPTKNHTCATIRPSNSTKHLCHSKTAQSDGLTEEPTPSGICMLDIGQVIEPRSHHSSRSVKLQLLDSVTRSRSQLKIRKAPLVGFSNGAICERSSARTQLDLLEQLTSSTSPGSGIETIVDPSRPTIRKQLSELVGDREGGDFSLPLGRRMKASLGNLTVSQKRNIKRQAYLNEVSRRNDSVFFVAIGALVILPPVVILSVAILTGYVQLFP